MIQLEEKKIPVVLIIIGIVLLVISNLTKEPYDISLFLYYEKNHISMSLSEYYVGLLGIDVSLKSIVVSCIVLIGLSIYLLIFKTDEEIRTLIGGGYRDKLAVNKKTKLNELPQKKINQDVNDDNIKLYKKIKLTKLLTLLYGVLILLVILILKTIDQDLIDSFTIEEYQTYSIILLIANLVNRAFATQVCYDLTKYNKGSKWLWVLCGFLFPALTLIYAGVKRSLQNEYKYLMEYYNQY
ncbi:hypothetical protein [Flavobacterium beibuense]|uniref:Uncharacterized protein n=1 Tax=Flavobacterium beibuense TaxID=657326 RepID=A0A444W6S2_9FLAO|nr:hypothetical protein [Flavobacterium beibuense]RYJ41569.1 hypothetical protein NU09_2943 [Flavobacterium beibuense]